MNSGSPLTLALSPAYRGEGTGCANLGSFAAARSAFTLVEVLLALLLSTALLAGLWAALEISLRMFESGRTRVEEAQLARALLHQFDIDLRQTVIRAQPSNAGEVLAPVEPGSSSSGSPSSSSSALSSSSSPPSVAGILPLSRGMGPQPAVAGAALAGRNGLSSPRQPGLIGTPHALRLDVYRTAPAGSASSRHRDVMAGDAVELRTVYYLLARAQEGDRVAIDEPAFQGEALVRYETSWLAAPGDRPLHGAMERQMSPQDLAFEEFLALEDRYEASVRDTFGAARQSNPAEELLLSPEVVRLEFRYFDGTEWLPSWDSDAQGGLPAAVEIVLALRPMAASFRAARQHETENEFGPGRQPLLPTARLVVPLPLGGEADAAEPLDDEFQQAGWRGGDR